MIHLDHLTYTYPGADDPALVNVTCDVTEGQFVLVAGPSGGGKSTLLRCLNGLVPHFSGGTLRGRATVAGFDTVAAGPQTLSRVAGFVFQDPEAQFVLDRVEDEIAFALENAAVPPAEMHARVADVLHRLDLTPLRDRTLATLSGGEKQRVAIAAALALRPRILILDEPTSQLDPQSADDVLRALVRLNHDLGLTIVLAEHRLERVLPYIDRIIYCKPASDSATPNVLSGAPRDVLRYAPLAPPVVALGRTMGWSPLPLTVAEARPFAQNATLEAPPHRRLHRARKPLLHVADLRYAYNGKPALRDASLDIAEGELVALMGRNGSGKTTLLKCIVGLLRASQGQISLAGRSLLDEDIVDICRDVGYLPQTPDDLLFADTVAEELAVTLRNHGLAAEPPVSPPELLARLDLAHASERYPRDLSAGQRQRVALGAIAVTRPKLLLLDEPTRGLDYAAKQALVKLLREWQAEGTAILLTTHDVELAAQAAERVVLLDDGAVIAGGPPGQLPTSPLFAPQMARLFPGRGWLTPEDVLATSHLQVRK